MQPYSPYYAPPAPPPGYRHNVFVPPGATASAVPSPSLRNAALALGVVQGVALLGAVGLMIAAIQESDGELGIASGVGWGVWWLALIAHSIVNLVWTYRFWSWVPPEHRHTSLWKKYISPGQAVGFLLIPYFNLYWMFVMMLGMCEVFDRLAVAYPIGKRPPKDLAIASIVVQFVFFPAAPFLQWMVDKELEAMAHATTARMGPRVVS